MSRRTGLRRRVLGDAERQARRVAQDMPSTAGSDVVGAEVPQPANLGREVVGAVVEMGPDRPVWLVEPLEEQLERRAGVVVPLAHELARRRADPPAGHQGLPEGHLLVLDRRGGVDADLDHATAVPLRPGRRLRRLVLHGFEDAEGQTARGQQRPPAVALTERRRPQFDGAVHGGDGVVALEVEVHPWRSVDLLEVDVGLPARWVEAPQLRVAGPGSAEAPNPARETRSRPPPGAGRRERR